MRAQGNLGFHLSARVLCRKPQFILRSMLTKNRTEITSEQVGQELLADPDSPWYEYRGRGPIAKIRSRRCCETMIFVLSSFIRLSELISRGTVTGQRTSTTRLRVSSQRAEHPNTQARARRDVMFGCSDVYHWMGRSAKAVCFRTADILALKAHNLDATTFWSAPQISATLPQRHRQFCASSSLTEGTRALDLRWPEQLRSDWLDRRARR